MSSLIEIREWPVKLSRREWQLKRVMDVLGALFSLLVTLPLWPVMALLIKVESPGPVIFAQKRVGHRGKIYRIFKFRSMVENAEELLPSLLDVKTLDPPVYKLENDPRVTRFGRFIRRTSLDEIPQLLNVLIGEMSLVGPRPEEVWLVERYPEEYMGRFMVKPGITGPMQVNGRADLSLDERILLELEYIEHYTPWRDVEILLKTIPAVLTGRGAR
jgi:lipopolysaccharide/colanic/teichoic acid biosynthesis glycosyltransferase